MITLELLELQQIEEINALEEQNTVVKMDHVSKTYQNGNIAVSNINLTIREGEFLSFVGPSGCGKSTIFKMISGLVEPSKGSIEIFGAPPKKFRENSTDIAFVFQDSTLLPWRKVIDNVMLPLEIRGMPKKVCVEKAYQVLELVGLKNYINVLPRHLSGGMKMRVSIARALISKPKLLLMDEPFGALDEITRQNLQYELLNIWKKHRMTVLFITHNVFEAVYLSTKIAVMTPSPGKIASLVDVPFSYSREDEFRNTHEFSDLVAKVSNRLKH
ncbi:ABC transporter ATP-binding protein [Bacillus methanolicus]